MCGNLDVLDFDMVNQPAGNAVVDLSDKGNRWTFLVEVVGKIPHRPLEFFMISFVVYHIGIAILHLEAFLISKVFVGVVKEKFGCFFDLRAALACGTRLKQIIDRSNQLFVLRINHRVSSL